jgi:hypothetical protein
MKHRKNFLNPSLPVALHLIQKYQPVGFLHAAQKIVVLA